MRELTAEVATLRAAQSSASTDAQAAESAAKEETARALASLSDAHTAELGVLRTRLSAEADRVRELNEERASLAAQVAEERSRAAALEAEAAAASAGGASTRASLSHADAAEASAALTRNARMSESNHSADGDVNGRASAAGNALAQDSADDAAAALAPDAFAEVSTATPQLAPKGGGALMSNGMLTAADVAAAAAPQGGRDGDGDEAAADGADGSLMQQVRLVKSDLCCIRLDVAAHAHWCHVHSLPSVRATICVACTSTTAT